MPQQFLIHNSSFNIRHSFRLL